ncbi:MAG: hypothetical protein J6T25_03785 [Bacilli bacterium]|nr:hypothetical protein [Bacilli bacterium]
MIGLLKAFGKGLLYVIGFPFFLLALLVFAVIGLLLFIYQIIRSIIYFFTGQKFFPELQEDKELRLRKEAANSANEIIDQPIEEHQDIVMPLIEERPMVSEPEGNSFETVEEACFNDTPLKQEEPEEEEEDVLASLTRDEPVKQETVEEEIIEEDNSFEEMKEETLKTAEDELTIAEDEELEEYIPKGSSITTDIDEEDTSNGVDIDYDL